MIEAHNDLYPKGDKRLGGPAAPPLDTTEMDAQLRATEARLAATEEALKQREQNEKAFASRSREIGELEQRLAKRESLINGRAYVSHDWLADPTGFAFGAVNGPIGGPPAFFRL